MTSQADLVERLEANAADLATARSRLQEVLDDYGTLLVEARHADPPITHRRLAAIYDVTEAAIVKKLDRTRSLTAVDGG